MGNLNFHGRIQAISPFWSDVLVQMGRIVEWHWVVRECLPRWWTDFAAAYERNIIAHMAGLSIGQLAKAADVPTSTVRYYERAGLLKPEARTSGNYRAYGPLALDRLKFIRLAQNTGLSLADIEQLLTLEDSRELPCDDVLRLLRTRLEEVRKRLGELRKVEKVLDQALKQCCDGSSPNLCEQVVGLGRRKLQKIS